MTIIRTLLSYSLLFLLVALLAAAWVYRDTLEPELNAAWSRLEARLEGRAPQDVTVATAPLPGESAEVATPEAPAETPAAPAAEAAPVETETPRGDTPLARHESEPVPESEPESESESVTVPATPAPVEPPAESEPEAPATSSAPETPAATETPAGIARTPAEPAAAMKASPEAPAAPVGEAPPAPTPETATPSEPAVAVAGEGEAAPDSTTAPEAPATGASGPSEEAILLDRARRAYWAGDLPAAAAAYEALLDRDPAEADVWGELGNVYYAMGRWQDAGLAYYEAARRLIDRGDTRQLGYLLRIIDSLAPDKGAELRARLAPGSGS